MYKDSLTKKAVLAQWLAARAQTSTIGFPNATQTVPITALP